MEKNTKRLILLASLVLVVVPMVIFPAKLGLPLLTASAIYMLYEVIFYGVVLYLFDRSAMLTTILTGAALTLVFRLTLGAAFGLAIIFMHPGLDSSIAFSLGMMKYLPAVIPHVLAAPFIVKPIYLNMGAESLRGSRRRARRIEPDVIIQPEPAGEVPPQFRPRKEDVVSSQAGDIRHDIPAPVANDEINQLDRAISYICESGAVKMALLVDDEGLTLARHNRSAEDFELWAPLSLLLENDNRTLINKYSKMGEPTKIDIGTKQARLFFRRIDYVTLMIMADETIDETIHIRIAQAVDMIRKYMSERYSPALFARAEERYVSNS